MKMGPGSRSKVLDGELAMSEESLEERTIFAAVYPGCFSPALRSGVLVCNHLETSADCTTWTEVAPTSFGG